MIKLWIILGRIHSKYVDFLICIGNNGMCEMVILDVLEGVMYIDYL